jgi:hypothetical protein
VTQNTTLHWTVHLARRRLRQAAAVAALIAGASVTAAYAFQSPFWGVLAAVLLTASVGDFLFPLTFSLDESGIRARGLIHRRHMSWKQVRRVVRDDLGLKLSPLPRPSRLEAYRGIYLWFADNADQVMAIIAHYRAPEAAGGDDLSPS